MITMRPRTSLPRLAVLLLAIGLGVCPKSAIAQPRDDAQPATSRTERLQRLGLASEPLRVDSLGLDLHPPRDAQTRLQRADERITAVLFDDAQTPAWSMRIQSIPRADPELDPVDQVGRILERWRKAGRSVDLIANEPAPYAGRVGQLCYVREDVDESTSVIHGWLVIEADQANTLVLSMQILPEAFDRIRPVLEASFATLRIRAAEEINQAREARLLAGRDFLNSLTPDRLRSLLDQRQWHRYYKPAAAGDNPRDIELGWFVIDFAEDKLGAINPARDESAYSPEEHQLGLLVTVYGHYVDRSTGVDYDSEAFYWMAWDQSREAWSIRTTRRIKGKQQSEAQSGIRLPQSTDHPAGLITVVNTGRDGTTRDQFNWRTPEVYLSQPIRWGLEQLLPRDEGVLRLAYYAVDTAGPEASLSLRQDELTPRSPSNPGWRLRTKTRADAEEVVAILNADGELVRRIWPQGLVAEPVTLDRLQSIWKDDAPSARDRP